MCERARGGSGCACPETEEEGITAPVAPPGKEGRRACRLHGGGWLALQVDRSSTGEKVDESWEKNETGNDMGGPPATVTLHEMITEKTVNHLL